MSLEGNATGNENIKSLLKGKIMSIPQVDATLKKEGYSADAKVVGEKFEGTISKDSKPFGDYAGNGSDSERVVDTKGLGSLMMLYCSSNLAFVTPKGAFVVDLSDGSNSWMDSAETNYMDGKLTIGASNSVFNKSDETYYYQVI